MLPVDHSSLPQIALNLKSFVEEVDIYEYLRLCNDIRVPYLPYLMDLRRSFVPRTNYPPYIIRFLSRENGLVL
jgi:hypothetical protein